MGKTIIFGIIALSISSAANADWIVAGAKITSVGSTIGTAGNLFYITVTGGVGGCAAAPGQVRQIVFNAATSSPDILKRSFSLANIAYLEKKKVDIHNYIGVDCNNASLITIYD
jgi:hypothetical protein